MDKIRKRAMTACTATRRSSAWAVDYDYLQDLPTKQLLWLAGFTNLHYHGSPHLASPIRVTDERRKLSYRQNNTRIYDLLNQGLTEHYDNMDDIADSFNEDYLLDLIDSCVTFKKSHDIK